MSNITQFPGGTIVKDPNKGLEALSKRKGVEHFVAFIMHEDDTLTFHSSTDDVPEMNLWTDLFKQELLSHASTRGEDEE